MWYRWAAVLIVVGVLIFSIFFVASLWARVRTKLEAIGLALIGLIVVVVVVYGDLAPLIELVLFYFAIAMLGSFVAKFVRTRFLHERIES